MGIGYNTDLDLGVSFVWDEHVLKNAEGKKKGTKRSDDESEDRSSTHGEKADKDDDEDDDNEKGEQTKTVVQASKRAKTKRQF